MTIDEDLGSARDRATENRRTPESENEWYTWPVDDDWMRLQAFLNEVVGRNASFQQLFVSFEVLLLEAELSPRALRVWQRDTLRQILNSAIEIAITPGPYRFGRGTQHLGFVSNLGARIENVDSIAGSSGAASGMDAYLQASGHAGAAIFGECVIVSQLLGIALKSGLGDAVAAKADQILPRRRRS